MFNAVGIDVSKGKSTVSVLQPGGVIVRKPFDVEHSASGLKSLTDYVISLDGDTRAVMECTGRYHEPILRSLSDAGVFVTAVNPHLIRNFGNNSIRKVKSDPADAKKVARYALDNWADLQEYTSMDTTRAKLKTLNAQLDFFTKQKASAKTNLISLLDMTYPGVNELFSSPQRSDGSEKWVDYVASFWHVDCVRKIGLKAFTERYKAFCKREGYNYSESRAKELFEASKELVAVFPKEQSYKDLIEMSIRQLRMITEGTVHIKNEMNELASTLPEYATVMSMCGVGPTLGPQLIAEIGDVNRFQSQASIAKYAGLVWTQHQSGNFEAQHTRLIKSGNRYLRYYLLEAANSVRRCDSEFRRYYDLKYKEVNQFQHKRALALTARKLVRLVFRLLKDDRLYKLPEG